MAGFAYVGRYGNTGRICAATGEVPYLPPPSKAPKPTPSVMPAPAYASDTDTEQEAWDTAQAYAPTVQSLVEWASGKWAKEERTAEALARQAEASQAGIFGPVAAANAGPLGLPWVVWLIAGGLGVYMLARR